jgi:hypothetical protein
MLVLSTLFLIFLLCLGLLGTLLIVSQRKQSRRSTAPRLDQIVPHFRPVDITELKEVLNIAEEGYLMLNLTPQQFRREQRDRIFLAAEYFGRMSHNVALLYRCGCEALLRSSKTLNRDTRQASRQLVDFCKIFRGVCWLTRLRLYLWLLRLRVLPFASIPSLADVRAVGRVDLVYTYEQIKAAASALYEANGASVQQLSSVL